jgi:aspartyl-tRNA(Asn)/glutamyl-tRNA(Gln) amidotransferase subunit A
MAATELGSAYQNKTLTPVEVAVSLLERISELDQKVNAFCLIDSDRVIEQANRSEQRYIAGTSLGPLDGIPVAIKDVFLTAGWPTKRGSRAIDSDQDWKDDAPAVSRLHEAGAVLLGKTTTPELGWKGVTDSPLTGITRNPWHQERTAGGSSGGSAAALAGGFAPLALGTDGGGSVRIPAAMCGVVGFKPSYGVVPYWPASAFGTLAHAGPMARTVMDAALLLDVIRQPDRRDPSCTPSNARSFAAIVSDEIAGLRIAVSTNLGGWKVEEQIAAAVMKAADCFADMGAIVELQEPAFNSPARTFEMIWNAGAALAVDNIALNRRELMDPGLLTIADEGSTYSAIQLLRADERRRDLAIRMSEFHSRWDLLITPTLPIAAFEAGIEVPAGWPHRRWHSWTPFTYPFNMTGQPAATVPSGLTSDGLPIGLQVVGAVGADDLVLRAAQAFEASGPLGGRRPPELAST